MNEPSFLRHSRGLTLEEIVALTGATLASPPPHPMRVVNVAPLDRASPHDLAFFDNRRFATDAAATHAGVCLTKTAFVGDLPANVTVLTVPEPFRAFVVVARALFPQALRPSSLSEPGKFTGAHVDLRARLEDGVSINPGAVIGPDAEIGSGSIVGANAVIGAGVRIGRECSIGANATISDALIGDRVIIHPGCKIGQDGFGYVMGAQGHLKVPQVGRVIIQDDVEIGAGTTIDRGAIRDTVIGEGTKIDNLVQVGHNVRIGRHCILVALTGISGSATVEDFVVLGARVGLGNDVTVGEGAQVAAISNVHGDVPAGARWGGSPAKPIKLWFREMKMLARLARRESGSETAADE
jgi:UDP-3-O-[3-hydroxymyristoyl] glucosamine N-acyltransferase